MLESILIDGAKRAEISMTKSAAADFRAYFELLEEKNKVMNLTAISGEEDVAKLHFLDSLMLMKVCDVSMKKIIDVGTGAGFPGLPIKIADRSVNLTLLDALQKRINFLEEVCIKIGLGDVELMHERAEDAAKTPQLREKFDIVTSRAVARLNVLCELCLPFAKEGGVFAAMKSTDTEEEINEAKPAVKLLGGKIEKCFDYEIPGADIMHRIVVIRKISETPKAYPRRFAKIQKEPLK